jgi:hypothetical protein
VDSSVAKPDNDVEQYVRRIWGALALNGCAVPVDPIDLDLQHLAHAERTGLDVAALLDAATPRAAAVPAA